jgi:hypothetical protein
MSAAPVRARACWSNEATIPGRPGRLSSNRHFMISSRAAPLSMKAAAKMRVWIGHDVATARSFTRRHE